MNKKIINKLIKQYHPDIKKTNKFYITLYQHYYHYDKKFLFKKKNIGLTLFF